MKIKNLIIIILIVILVLLVSLLGLDFHAKDSIPILLSVLALFISLISAFKSDIFPFELNILAGDEITIYGKRAYISSSMPFFIMPITFLNNGYGEGIVEIVSIILRSKNCKTIFYRPVFEIDFLATLKEGGKINSNCIISSFISFPIHSRKSIKKYYLFSQNDTSKKYPPMNIEPGKYLFGVYVKTNKDPKQIKKIEFEFNFTSDTLKEIENGDIVNSNTIRFGD